ncbi:MAG: AraC family transcriptional regulator [Oscillospiraceae bacterium]
MQKQVFPVIGDEKELPFYIVGIGIECWQFPINRPDGYEFPQLFVTREGEGEITIGGETVRLLPDTVFYIPKGCPHEYHSLSESWIINWVCFSGFEAEPLLEKWGLDKYGVYPSADAERMHKIMSKAYYTIKSDKIYGNHYASAQLYDLLIEYRKIADNRQSALSSSGTAALADVLEHIENNYAKPIKLGELAEIAGITEQHLCRLFKKNFQLRPMEYLTKVRLRHAKEMLVYSEKSIAEVAEASGFPSSSYFSAVFKRYESVTPGEYRVKI